MLFPAARAVVSQQRLWLPPVADLQLRSLVSRDDARHLSQRLHRWAAAASILFGIALLLEVRDTGLKAGHLLPGALLSLADRHDVAQGQQRPVVGVQTGHRVAHIEVHDIARRIDAAGNVGRVGSDLDLSASSALEKRDDFAEVASRLGCGPGLLKFRCEWFSIPFKRPSGTNSGGLLTCVRTLISA